MVGAQGDRSPGQPSTHVCSLSDLTGPNPHLSSAHILLLMRPSALSSQLGGRGGGEGHLPKGEDISRPEERIPLAGWALGKVEPTLPSRCLCLLHHPVLSPLLGSELLACLRCLLQAPLIITWVWGWLQADVRGCPVPNTSLLRGRYRRQRSGEPRKRGWSVMGVMAEAPLNCSTPCPRDSAAALAFWGNVKILCQDNLNSVFFSSLDATTPSLCINFSLSGLLPLIQGECLFTIVAQFPPCFLPMSPCLVLWPPFK